MPKKLDIEKAIQILSGALRCPVCDYRYNLESTKIIDSRQDGGQLSLVIHSNCQKCKSNVVFSVNISGPDIFSVGMITDLTSRDAKKFSDSRMVTAQDVMAMHQFLDRFDGDLVKALS